MPLKILPTDGYIKRHLVLVDSKNRVPERSKGPYDYSVDVPEEIQNVVGLEIVGWNFNSLISPTFVGRYDTFFANKDPSQTPSVIPGIKTFELEIFNETSTASVVLPVDLENLISVSPLSFTNMRSKIAHAVQESLDGALGQYGNAAVNNTNTTIFATITSVNSAPRLGIVAYRSAAPNDPLPATIRFTDTIEDAEDRAMLPLGFRRGDVQVAEYKTNPVIVLGPAYEILSPFEVNEMPLRYIDVFVRQTEGTYSPQDRINLVGDTDAATYAIGDKKPLMRILTDPIRRLERLDIRLQFPQGVRIPESLNINHQLSFEVLSLEQSTSVPSYVKQKFVY